MEYAQRAYGNLLMVRIYQSLNPCTNGICSKRGKTRIPHFINISRRLLSHIFTISKKNISFFGGAKLQTIINISKNDYVKLAHIYTVFLYEQIINTHETSQI